jgi:serine/threonine-protein kinase HipA
MEAAFKQFVRGLARHAPGSDEDTVHALEACELPDSPLIYDMGAGTGASTLVLAEELAERGGEIVAVDQMTESLKTLTDRAERRGLTNVRAVEGDFLSLDLDAESVDAIWAEGAIYAAGWDQALDAWIPATRPGGYIVASDVVWTTEDRPAEAVAFWESEYPAMTTAPELEELARGKGLEVVSRFELHRTGWLDYYGPIRQRAQLFGSSQTSEGMTQVVDAMTKEIEIFEAHGHAWNYVFLVLKRTQ